MRQFWIDRTYDVGLPVALMLAMAFHAKHPLHFHKPKPAPVTAPKPCPAGTFPVLYGCVQKPVP